MQGFEAAGVRLLQAGILAGPCFAQPLLQQVLQQLLTGGALGGAGLAV